MNLNCVKELTDLYKNFNNPSSSQSQSHDIDVTKLKAIYFNLNPKNFTIPPESTSTSTRKTRSSNNSRSRSTSNSVVQTPRQLASQCWNILVLLNKHPSSSFFHTETFLLTAYFILECSKVIESVETSLKMGPYDLDKLLANLVAKLTEGCKGSAIEYRKMPELSDHLFCLLSFIFKRLRRLQGEEKDQQFQLEDPFMGYNFKIEPRKDEYDDAVLLQLIVIALESLVRLSLVYSQGPVEDILVDLQFFYRKLVQLDPNVANKIILQFISSFCKFEFWSEIEWKLWSWIFVEESCARLPEESVGYFKKRLLLKLNFTPPPPDCVDNGKMIGFLLSSGLFTEVSLNLLDQFNPNNLDFQIALGLISILAKDDNTERNNCYFKRIECIFIKINSNPNLNLNLPDQQTEHKNQGHNNLKYLLAALDSVRNELFRLIRIDDFVSLLLQLNVFLFKAYKIPDKFYISWSSFVIKSFIEGCRDKEKKKMSDFILKCSVTDLLEILPRLTASSASEDKDLLDLKDKTLRLICQAIGFAADVELLKRFSIVLESRNYDGSHGNLSESKQLLLLILQNSVGSNLCRDFFTELSRLSFLVQDENDVVLIAWVKVLKCQLHLNRSIFSFSCIAIGLKIVKLLAIHVIDDLKFEQCIDLVNQRLVELKLSTESVYLNYLTSILKYKNKLISSFKYKFSDPKINLISALIQRQGSVDISEILITTNESQLHEIEVEFYNYFLTVLITRFDVKALSKFLKNNFHLTGTIKERILYQLDEEGQTTETPSNTELQSMNISDIHNLYLKCKYEDALKLGYEGLKRKFCSNVSNHDAFCNEELFNLIELISYLFKLSITTRNLSEAKYFLKQLSELSKAFNSVGLVNFVCERLQQDLDDLIGKFKINYQKCEQILTSRPYSIFSHEYNSLMHLRTIRPLVSALFSLSSSSCSSSIMTNGIKVKTFQKMEQLENLMKCSHDSLKQAQQYKMYYCIGEWAKIVLSLKFIKSMLINNDVDDCERERERERELEDMEELLKYFELSRRPECGVYFESTSTTQTKLFNPICMNMNSYSGTLGFLYDQMSSVFWIFIINLQSKLVVFRCPIVKISTHINRIIQISTENTETLKNTKNLDETGRINWWKRRKSLNFELVELCQNLCDDLFLNFQELIFPYKSSSNSTVLHDKLNKFVKTKFPASNLKFTTQFAGQLCRFGPCPKRVSIEFIIKLLYSSKTFSSTTNEHSTMTSSEESSNLDKLIFDLRKCFENSFNLGSIFEVEPDYEEEDLFHSSNPTLLPFNLLLDKDLNKIPFESFPLFINYPFKRIPRLIHSPNPEIEFNTPVSSVNLNTVFYIINPSGDLTQTQDRFQNIFLNQKAWTGIIGRAPSADEFFTAINGKYDLFIYFGHSGGEIYAPLKELKTKIKSAHSQQASSALLIGCSSGKIKSNSVFPADSTIFHYLDNNSPLILANLWDVTDKDIDNFIKNVMEESFILTGDQMDINTKSNSQTQSKHLLLMKNTQTCRKRCHLTGLNGFAPIIYGII